MILLDNAEELSRIAHYTLIQCFGLLKTLALFLLDE